MTLPTDLAVSIAVLAAAVLIVLVLFRARTANGVNDRLVRIGQQLDVLMRSVVHQDHESRRALHEHERLRRADHAALVRMLERRLGEASVAQERSQAESRAGISARLEGLERTVSERIASGHTTTVKALGEMREQTRETLLEQQARFEQRNAHALGRLQDTMRAGMQAVQRQVSESLARSSEELGKRVDGLTRSTDQRLQEISGEVERRLAEGFEKTNATFGNVIERLALIDAAQRRIDELSSNVVSLQEVLADKRSRGAFGEVQLASLVGNVLPASSYALQHVLGNGRRADCMLFLPEPTGHIAVDAKFPLESYQRMTDPSAGAHERRAAEQQFRHDVRAHVRAIEQRYIVPGETGDGAVMFVPAEAVFAEIHAHHPQLVQEAHRARVWMASPTTLMAILNTARAVLKDEATRRQIHVIRRHLAELARDFDRFRERMDRLAAHIDRANRDVKQVHTSAGKIRRRFETIEKVEMEGEPTPTLDADGRETGDTRPGDAASESG